MEGCIFRAANAWGKHNTQPHYLFVSSHPSHLFFCTALSLFFPVAYFVILLVSASRINSQRKGKDSATLCGS
jgi:hypothetical protein